MVGFLTGAAPSRTWNVYNSEELSDILCSAISPGDTVILSQGDYTGPFTANLHGLDGLPVVIKPANGARVKIIDGLTLSGQYTEIRGLEFSANYETRISEQVSSNPTDTPPLGGVVISGNGNSLINNVIHNVRDNGVADYQSNQMGIIYGNIIINNGWSGPDRGHGHGIYSQNNGNNKVIKNNIIMQNYSTGVKLYGEEGLFDNYSILGNISFENGSLYIPSAESIHHNWDILIGSAQRIGEHYIIDGNVTFNRTVIREGDGTIMIGWINPLNDMILTGNYFIGIESVRSDGAPTNSTIESNVFVGAVSEEIPRNGNTVLDWPNIGDCVIVTANEYDDRRAHVAIYNQSELDTVQVDLSSVLVGLSAGSSIKAMNIQDYFGDVQTLVLDESNTIAINMTGRTVETPKAWIAPETTFPKFGVFLITW